MNKELNTKLNSFKPYTTNLKGDALFFRPSPPENDHWCGMTRIAGYGDYRDSRECTSHSLKLPESKLEGLKKTGEYFDDFFENNELTIPFF